MDTCKVLFETEAGNVAREFTYNVHTRARIRDVRAILTGEGVDDDKAFIAFPICVKNPPTPEELESADVHDVSRAVLFFLSWTANTAT